MFISVTVKTEFNQTAKTPTDSGESRLYASVAGFLIVLVIGKGKLLQYPHRSIGVVKMHVNTLNVLVALRFGGPSRVPRSRDAVSSSLPQDQCVPSPSPAPVTTSSIKQRYPKSYLKDPI